MKDMECDVLVVGAGPAGSVAAKYAAMAGMNVLMIEKRAEIGSPVRCGEGIAKRWLDEIGVKPSDKWIAHEVDGAKIFAPNGKYVIIDEKHAGAESGYVVDRDVFDKEMATDALKAGADIMLRTSAIDVVKEGGTVTGVKARHMGETFSIKAGIVVGADGFESQIGRWAGIDTRLKAKNVDSCYQVTLVGVEGDPKFNEFYLGNAYPGGYLWVFWKGKDVANVGIGVQLSRIKEKGEAKMWLEKFLETHPRFGRGKPIREIAGGVSTCAPIDCYVGNGIMLAGDAARLIDPITGGGVYYGCVSGKLAGEVAAEAVRSGDTSKEFLMKYDRLVRDRLEDTLYRNWMIKEKLVTLSDDVYDKIIDALSDADIGRVGVLEILESVYNKYPELAEEFKDFI